MPTRWKAIAGFPAYQVSDQGQVMSLPMIGRRTNGEVLKPIVQSNGYHYVGLYEGGKMKLRRIHSLVLEAFVGPRPDGAHGCHRDDDKSNNALENLYWGTASQNMADAYANGRRVLADSCGKGHEFTEQNTYIRKDTGARMCRQCMLERNRRNKSQTPRAGGLYGGKGDSYV